MVGKSKYEIESVVSVAVSKFLKEHMCEQVEAMSTHFIEDTIIVRLKDFWLQQKGV